MLEESVKECNRHIDQDVNIHIELETGVMNSLDIGYSYFKYTDSVSFIACSNTFLPAGHGLTFCNRSLAPNHRKYLATLCLQSVAAPCDWHCHQPTQAVQTLGSIPGGRTCSSNSIPETILGGEGLWDDLESRCFARFFRYVAGKLRHGRPLHSGSPWD